MRARLLLALSLLAGASLAPSRAFAQARAPAPQASEHWAYRAPARPPLPEVSDAQWPRNAIDRFVLARLERDGIAPGPEADRATLARRVSLDLTGLPPASGELDAFLGDAGEGAYERYVERLLASPHYGERWAQHWLDLARYADSHGFTFDDERTMWPYRDWVIDAFNRDMPFDQFTIEQLAGDLLPEPSEAQLVATGFHRNTMTNQEGGADDEEFRVVAVKDRVDTTATVWLGTTLACAQCHDHKYDPFSQGDYYRFYAFFDQTQDTGTRSEPELALERAAPGSVLVMRAVETPRVSRMMKRGSFLDLGAVVEAGVPAALPPLERGHEPPTRLDLARWLMRRDNPLTARVTVNRWWQRFFGSGLVATENDFGTRGRLPTHPGLLDWLALELVESGYRVKDTQRLIVQSATYRQSTAIRPELWDVDPRNRYLARQNRLRLDAEAIRDSALAASGLLQRDLGGPPVYPPQAEGVFAFTQKVKAWPTSPPGPNGLGAGRYRRTLYTWLWRTSPFPFRMTFDAPDPAFTCTRRDRSNTPLQALTLANDPMMVELAAGLAGRALAATCADEDERLRSMVRWSLGREPEKRELEILRAFLDAQLGAYAADPNRAQALVFPSIPEHVASVRAAAWVATARVLFNLDEFVTRG